ncbi:hypothetical protein [uncultured Desulfovibrio sp.]|uniref:hypothetical protein n=1 Tax=uncultured Desulfovibrio sp. TaxID=167968 RepID=UPI0026225768|nr:hypothetical protein [uncultured Desulfovibrio sp.]
MIFFCRRTNTVDGRSRWSVSVPTLLGFTTVGWFYSEELAVQFLECLEATSSMRRQAELDAWNEMLFRLDFLWAEKLQQKRSQLEARQEDIRTLLEDFNARLGRLLVSGEDPESGVKAVWDDTFARLGQVEDMALLARTLHAQSRVLTALQAELCQQARLRQQGGRLAGCLPACSGPVQ